MTYFQIKIYAKSKFKKKIKQINFKMESIEFFLQMKKNLIGSNLKKEQ